jgi:hypothetical protein
LLSGTTRRANTKQSNCRSKHKKEPPPVSLVVRIFFHRRAFSLPRNDNNDEFSPERVLV